VIHRLATRELPGGRAEHAEDLQQVLRHQVITHHPGRLCPLERAGGRFAEAGALVGGDHLGADARHDVVEALVLGLHHGARVQEGHERLADLIAFERFVGHALELEQDVLEDRAHERFLGGEAAVQRALADAGAAGDLLHAHVEPGLREGSARGVEDAGAVPGSIGPQRADMGLHRRRSYYR
jgi:hypothetical protein